MDALQARINTFKKSKRVKNLSKPSSTTTLKWPHPPHFRANPESLAEAGFYYDPSYDDPDNVTCYVCAKELGGWEEDDDPFFIHWTKCGQTCCWASARCGLTSDLDHKGRFISGDKSRVPTHKTMEKARHDTYLVGKGWIHDKTANHGACSKMMARAGFVYTPQHNGDDLATCFYCNTSLSGWDAEDDPLEEHRKRDNKSGFPCPFFTISTSEIAPSSKPVSRAQSSKPSSKSQGKPPSRSASRSKHQDVILPTKNFDGELEDESDDPSQDTTQTTAKTPGKGRTTSSSSGRKSSTKTPKDKTRSSSRSGLKNVVEEESDAPQEPQPTTAKKSRSRSKSVVRPEVDEVNETHDDEPVTRKPSRSRAKKIVSDAEEDLPRKSSRSKSKASIAPSATDNKAPRTKSKSKVVDSEQEDIPAVFTKTKSKTKPVESEQDDNPPITTKPKHKRAASRSKAKATIETSDVEPGPEPDILEPAPKKKNAAKTKTPQVPAAQNLFDDDVFTDHYVHTPASPPPVTTQTPVMELPPLFVPKRPTAKKLKASSDNDNLLLITQDKKIGKAKKNLLSDSQSVQSRSEEEEVKLQPPPPTEEQRGTSPILSPPPHTKERGIPVFEGSKGKQKLKVVEISSDEEPQETDRPQVESNRDQEKASSLNASKSSFFVSRTPQAPSVQPEFSSKPIPSQTKRQKSIVVEIVQPVKPSRSPSPKPPLPLDNDDVNMQDIDPEETNKIQNVPSTPPRTKLQVTSSEEPTQHPTIPAESTLDSAELPFIPALSKLPFMPLNSLSEPELDMTVEEWIRYQMDVEFDKFKRDGERELQRFRKRAEEVRKVIEGL